MNLGVTKQAIPIGLPSTKTIVQFVAGAVVGFVLDKIVEYIYVTYVLPEMQKAGVVTSAWGFPVDDVVLAVLWIVIAFKWRAFGAGGFIGMTIGSISGWTPWAKKE